MRQAVRVAFPLGTRKHPPMPAGLGVHSFVDDPLRDVTWAIVVGDGLPQWPEGSEPWQAEKWADLEWLQHHDPTR